MKRILRDFSMLILTIISLFASSFIVQGQSPDDKQAHRISLPNGWSLTPAGRILPLGDLPLNIAISPSKKLAAITNNGQSDQSIQLVDIEKEIVTDSVTIGKSWLGLHFSANGRQLYASGGNDNMILRYTIHENHMSLLDTIIVGKPWPEKISIAGIALDDSKNRLYAVTKENNSLYVIDTKSKKIIWKYALGGEGFTCILSPDRKTLYISCWGCDKIILFDTKILKITGSITVGDNPNDMCITGNGRYLFVANANDNSVSIIDTRINKVIEKLNSALYPDSPTGSTPNSVALSGDETTLFIANADNNSLAVFDVTTPGSCRSKGFIPTGWYPTCVRVVENKILVTNGKGLSSMANPYGPDPYRKDDEVVYQSGGSRQMKEQYIGGLFRGNLGIINMPDINKMASYTQDVYKNSPYSKKTEVTTEGENLNPVPTRVGDYSPIKYIFYVIKENRTYDQVLGDIPTGNGDPGLVLFGEKITPNQHAIAREFVLLDNFFVDGEVSADGHNWTMGAYATDYNEKNWPTSYGGRGGSYDSEGEREIANNKKGYLWDNCKRNGVSYRTYGEFIGEKGPNIPVLKDHYSKAYGIWDQRVRDTVRFGIWKRDFDSLLKADVLPQMNTVRLINDHTEGLSLGRPSPFAHVADNDLAVGMFVDYLSHSPVWNQSLILIVEDDAQNGPDHVDAHRSTAYIAGGYVKQGFVDHTSYSTSSLLRTIELILGLPPMSQYDAAATPLWRSMNMTSEHPPFNARPCLVDLDEKNTSENIWQQKSEKFDFSREDRVNDAEFNEVLWKAVKGIDSQCPPAVHAAFFFPDNKKEED
jgi:YVTN family beta-propeller protein